MTDTDPTSPDAVPSSWSADDNETVRVAERRGRKVWIVVIVVVIAAVAGVAYAVTSGAFDGKDRAWPAQISVRPDGLGQEHDTAAHVTPTAEPGVYIWNSFDGWHLWVVNGNDVAGVKGTITSSDRIKRATSSAPKAGTVTAHGKTVSFDLDGSAKVAGVDFEPGFSHHLVITLDGPDGPVSVTVVHLGHDAMATAVPVVIDKPVVN